MKKGLLKQIFALLMVLVGTNISAQCNGGNIKVYADSIICSSNLATLKLSGHTTTSGTIYTWQRANSNTPYNFGSMGTNSGTDTQNINPGLFGWYRCRVLCATGVAYSDTFFIGYQPRQIQVKRIQCDLSGGGNDSVVIRALVNNPPVVDTNSAKSFRWEATQPGATVWNFYAHTKVDSIKLPFNKAALDYQVKISICPIYSSLAPTPFANQLLSAVRIGLKPSKIDITAKDCPNNEASISILNPNTTIRNILKDSLKYTWYSANTWGGTYTAISGATSSILKVNPSFRQNKFYYATTKLCNTAASALDTTNTYALWVTQGTFAASYDCLLDSVLIDYQYRDSVKRSASTTWYRSANDSLNKAIYTVPSDLYAHYFDLVNKTNTYYKIYTMLCPNSPVILDSSNFVRVFLNVDSGELKIDTVACSNDSVYLQLLNYNGVASFPISSVWEYKQNGVPYWEDYTLAPQTTTTTSFKMRKGLTSYRKSFYFCPTNKFAKKTVSSIATTFLPYQLVYDTFNCDTASYVNMRVLNDSIRYTDYTGTKYRLGPKTYSWIESTNKITSSFISGQSGRTLSILNLYKDRFYRRIATVCPSAPQTRDTTDWSNFRFSKPNSANGKAVVISEICLDRRVTIGVDNFTVRSGTPYYVWQTSPDELTWTDLLTSSSNLDTTGTIVTSQSQFFRRLTYWCPSGIIDSSQSIPVRYNKPIGCETFVSIPALGANKLYNCWGFSNACSSWTPKYGTNPIYSRGGVGKSDIAMSHQTQPPTATSADGHLITPAYELKRGKVYRFSFWHKEGTGNICWDSLYVTWGRKATVCDINNIFGDTLTKFSFDQFAKFWADFFPPEDGIYYFAINYREANDPNKDNIVFDDVCIKEVQSCAGKNPVKGATFAPSRIVDRIEEPFAANSYDKDRVTHQYCIWDTIMLTYNETNYATNFDYYGMTYQFYRMRYDEDWKINDYYYSPVPKDNNCHITNKSDYHVMNILVTDTNTFYKIVATCRYDGKEYHSDSLVINGTHSVPYCEDWEGVGDISSNNPLVAALFPVNGIGNCAQIIGQVPGFSFCPTCWAVYPQPVPPAPNAADISMCSCSLPFRNQPGGTPAPPQLDPDQGWQGKNVLVTTDNRAMATTKNVVVFPAVRLYKGRSYRVTFRWADNRKDLGAPNYGADANRLDSLYLTWAKGNQMGKSMANFTKANMIGTPELALKSNLKESGSPKYRTFWKDFTPTDTGTYYFGVVIVPGTTSMSAAYRFQMDYFCIDTITLDTGCGSQPKFEDPLMVRISPDAKTWLPGDTSVSPGIQWCVGTTMNIELSTGVNAKNSWNYGWKMQWERNIVDPVTGNPAVWNVVSTSNSYSWVLRYKYENYRLRITNYCGTKDTIIGPFNIFPGGLGAAKCGGATAWTEDFEPPASFFPACWDGYSTPNCPWARAAVSNTMTRSYNAKSGDWYLSMDNESAFPTCGALQPQMVVVPPGRAVSAGVTYRFSFWYRDNGRSQTWDSLRMGWSLVRPTSAWPAANTLINRVNGDIVKNFRGDDWRYYTTEFTPTMDTVYHFKISNHLTATTKRLYRLNYDDFEFKPKFANDALVIAVDSPENNCGMLANSTVKVTVMNIGSNTLTDIPLGFSVDNGSTVTTGTATVPGSLTSNQIKTYYLTNVDLSSVGNNKIKVWTDVSGENYRCDDTFTRNIIHNRLYETPTDSIDSVCIYSNLRRTEGIPSGGPLTKWYKNFSDVEPFMIADTFKMDSFSKDTCIYRSIWNGEICNTTPLSTAVGIPVYTNATAGITFDNYSNDTLIIDSTMIYAQSVGNGTVTVTQFGVTIASTALNVSALGRQFKALKFKIPPGTDYKMVYSGPAQMASLPTAAPYYYIFAFNGCPAMDFNIKGDHNNPAASAAYYYFFNMKLIRPGCETPKAKICFKPVAAPFFRIKDTARVCSDPVYQICGPDAPAGDAYTYIWAPSNSTAKCDSAIGSKVYKLTVTNSFGCKIGDSIDLIVDPSPNYSLGRDTSFCRYSPYIIRTGLPDSNHIVTWSDYKSGVNDTVLNPGTYISTAFNTVNFCSKMDTIVLSRIELPIFSLGSDRVYCGETANLAITLPKFGQTYVWGSNGGPVINKSQVNSSGKGTFTVIGTDSVTKCKNTDTVVATLISYPNLDLGPDLTPCGPLYISPITPAPGPYYYTWSNTYTTRAINVAVNGTYKLTVQDSVYGCSSSDSVNVTFKKTPVFSFGPDVVKCSDAETLFAPSAVMTGITRYTWKGPKGVIPGNVTSVVVDTSGKYCLTVDNGCYTYESCINYTLKKPANSAIDLLKDSDTGCKQVTLTVTSQPLKATIKWGYPIPSAVSNSNTLLIKNTGSYSVSLVNECGSATKSVFVKIDTNPVANFTPINLPNCMSIGLKNLSVNASRFEWDFGDGANSVLENPLHNYQIEGNYIVTLRASNSCGFASKSLPIDRRVKNCDSFALSIVTNLEDANLYVFPNPTKDKTTLYGIGLPNGKYVISVRNILGQLIEELDAKIVNHKLEHSIDASLFANGEYVIQVSNERESIVRRLIVNK